MKKSILLFFALIFALSAGCSSRSTPPVPISSESVSESSTIISEPTRPEEVPYVTDNQNPVAPEHRYIINKIVGDPKTDEEAIAILDRLLQHAFYLSYDVLSFDTMYVYDTAKEKSDEEGSAYGPVNANVYPYNNLADLQADMANTFTDDVYTDTQMRALKDPKYYKDFDGKLYCLKGVSGVSMARSWDVEGVQTLTITENKIMAEMPVERLETFSATLEAVKVDGVWVLNKSYFADPQDSN